MNIRRLIINILTLGLSGYGFIPESNYISVGKNTLHESRRRYLRDNVIIYHKSSKQRKAYSIENRAMTAGGFGTGGKAPFEIRGFSLSNIILGLGGIITGTSFMEYFSSAGSDNSGSGLSGIGFVYGLPIILVGCALKYGEIEPVPIKATAASNALFEMKKTETIEQIKKDVTRHRYGDEAHLDTTVKSLGLMIPKRRYPQLKYLEYGISDENELEFMMVWESLDTPFTIWNENDKLDKYDTYFGPNIWSKVVKVSGSERLVGIKLTTGERPESENKVPELGEWRMGCE
jgi:hypothetical protein